MSESRQGVNEQLMKVSEYTDINSLFKILKKTSWGGLNVKTGVFPYLAQLRQLQ